MRSQILLIVPTRDRLEKVKEFYELFKVNSSVTDLCFAIDDDDDTEYPAFDNVIYERNPRGRLGMNDKLNLVANKYAEKYKYIAFLGDDHRIRTKDWDQALLSAISEIKNGIVYGNDLFQGEKLPTAVLMDSNIISVLGFMSPPKQQHLYLDNFWKDLGEALGTLRYLDEVVLEHMHFVVGKSEKDSLYEQINSEEMYHLDKQAYDEYLNNQFEDDLRKLGES